LTGLSTVAWLIVVHGWGWGVKTLFQNFEQFLSGWPDAILSVSLIASGIVVILFGLFAPRAVKLLVLAWIWFP
jgi:hypothetical protein